MKQKFIYILLFLLFSCPLLSRAAQTTEGTEFWLTFMKNYIFSATNGAMQLKLIVSSRQSGHITVTNPQTGWSNTLSVTANQIGEMVIPNEQAYTYAAEIVENHGLQVTSTVPISLYASNYHEYTYDATIVLPTTALGKDYIIQTYENELMSKEFCVVATTDNTTLSITPHARTTTERDKNEVFTVTLNKGQTYQVMSSDGNNDFSGSQIHASAPVAVFSGHQCINVPTNNKACDHIVEQSIPVEQWGTQFALTKTNGQNGDRVAITAHYDNTQIKMNGEVQTTLNALQTWEFRLTDNSAFVETSQPAACYIYLEGATANNHMGDPSSVHISPVEQRIKEITFATFQTYVSRSHYVNVVTTQSGAENMTLDGKNVAELFSPLTGNSSLYFAQISISHGTHTLRTTTDGFIGHVYGLGWCESYAYSFGSATIWLDGQIVVDGEPHNEQDDGIQRCYLKPIVFSPAANINYNALKWDLGDGTISTQSTITHTYSAPGDYTVTLILYGDENNDTTHTVLHLVDVLHNTIRATLCQDETYQVGTEVFSESGTYDVKLTSAGGCDSIVTLVLNVLPTYQTDIYQTIVTGTSFRWHYKWYNAAGTYTDIFTSSTGCDSVTILHLELIDQAEDMYDTICYRPTYSFKGYDYTLPPIDDYKDRDYVDYTLEYRDLELCTTYRMHLAIIPMENGEQVILHDTILQGSTYDFYGQLLDKTGTYTTVAEGACGCSLNYTLYLVVLPMPIHDVSASLCHEDTFIFCGKPYTKPGQYMDTIWNDAGIVSIERLTLTDDRSFTTLNVSDVSSYDFNGKILTESGTYRDTLPAANGCDSIITLNLGIGGRCVASYEENIQICYGESYSWNGETYSEEGSYIATFTTDAGCDSTATLHLTILPKLEDEFSATINEDEYYKWNGVKYTESGDYEQILTSQTGCDSVVTLHLTVKASEHDTTAYVCEGNTFEWYGNEAHDGDKKTFIDISGHDSIVTLHLITIPVPSLVVKADTMINKGDTALLWATGADYYSWEPAALVVKSDAQYVEAYPTISTTFTVTGYNEAGKNMLVNGDFELGNTGFTTTYKYYEPRTTNEFEYGKYTIGQWASDLWPTYQTTTRPDFPGYNNSWFMVVDGSESPDAMLWEQTVEVKPNNDYALSCLLVSLLASHKHGKYALLQFYINGQPIGEIFHSPSSLHEWTQFYEVWNSGTATSATIQIINQNNDAAGNDFGLDNISFVPLMHDCATTEQVTVLVAKTETEEHDVCSNELPYSWHGRDLTISGTYTDTILSTSGFKDSIVTLLLTVKEAYAEDDYQSKYPNELPFIWNGFEIADAGDYGKIYSTTSLLTGCDSVVTLHLTVLPPVITCVDTIPVVTRFDWVLMIHRKAIKEMGFDPTIEQIKWYKVVGEPDSIPDPAGDDIYLTSGYSYTMDANLQGSGLYYAVMDATTADSIFCQKFIRSRLIKYDTPPAEKQQAPIRKFILNEHLYIRTEKGIYDAEGREVRL